MKHLNKRQFVGIVGFVDVPSDKAPAGGRGHKIVLQRTAVTESIESLVGMGVCVKQGLDGHSASSKIGVITKAYLLGRRIVVRGWLYHRDCVDQVAMIQACVEPMGMSYELADAHVLDMRQPVWQVSRLSFTGAAVLRQGKAAYCGTKFWMERTEKVKQVRQ